MAENTTPQDGLNGLTDINTFTGPVKSGLTEYTPLAPLPTDIQQLPGGANIPNRAYLTKDFRSGSSPTYSAKLNQRVASADDIGKAAAGRMRNLFDNSHDPNAYGKMYTFDNSPGSGSFKARYSGYGEETYNKLGFDPTADTETWYNQNTTQFDDWKRMMTHAAWPMIKLGFMSPVNSYAKMLGHGDVGANLQEAKDYEYFNAIGNSTKGGLGGFMTNLQNSAAYSVGIMAEGLVEGAIIGAGIGFAEGGLAAVPGAAIGGITGTVKSLAKLPGALFSTAKNMGKIATSLKSLSNISNAKNFWASAGSKLANGLNPLDNTTELIRGWKDMGDLTSLARSARSVGAFWHDVKNINMALSEGRLEGGFSEQANYKKLYDEYYAKNGEIPSDDEQVRMMQQAKDSGFANTMWNTGLVFYSNKIAFPSVTRAGFLKGAPRFGSVVGTIGKEKQIIFNPGKKAAEAAYTLEDISIKNSLKALKSPKQWGKLAANYFKANLVEGFQEVGQEALSKATENYYINSYNNPALKNYRYALGAMGAGIKDQLSAQGAEVFASGFLMGSLISGPITAVQKFGSVGYNKYFKHKDNYKEYINNKQAQGQQIVEALNTMHQNGKYFFDPKLNNYSDQMLVAKVVDNPDNKTTAEIKDAGHQAFTTSVLTALQTGTFDTFIKNFADYKSATPEELEEAWSLEPGQGAKALQKLDKAIDNAKVIAKRFQFAQDKFGKYRVNPAEYKEGTIERQRAEFYNKAISIGINNLTFMQSAFDDTLKRSSKLYSGLADISSITGNAFADVALLTDPSRLNNQIQMLSSQITSAEESNDPQIIEKVRKDLETMKLAQDFQDKQKTLRQYVLDTALLPEEELYKRYSSDPIEDYKASYHDLLKGLAGTPEKQMALDNDISAKGGIDVLFDELLDTDMLKNQAAGLSKYVNLLSNPKDFLEHVDRNYEWMQNLYNNKKEYFQSIVNEQMAAIERNALLNALADRGIFVDLEQFANWVEDNNNYPEYFIDETRGMLINQDSPLYADYLDLFIDATNMNAIPAAGNPASEKEKMQDRLDDVEERRSKELEDANEHYNKELVKAYGKDEAGIFDDIRKALNEDTTEEERAALEIQKEQQEVYLNILNGDNVQGMIDIYPNLEELVSEEAFNETQTLAVTDKDVLNRAKKRGPLFNPDAQTPEDKADAINNALTIEVYKTILEGNIKTLEEQIKNLKAPETFDIEASPEYKAYQSDVKQIHEKYDAYVQEVKDEFAEKGIDENTIEEVTPDTPYENLPEDFKAFIEPMFQEHLKEIGETNPETFDNIRRNWLQQNPQLFKEYGEKAKALAVERAKQLARPPFLKFFKLQVSGKDSLNLLGEYLRNLQKIVDTGKFISNKKSIDATADELNLIKEDIEALEGYMNSRKQVYKPQNIAQETFNNVEQNIINRRAEVQDVFNEEGVKIGRKFVGQETTPAVDIEKRRQELTTFTYKRTFIKGVAHEVQIAKKFNHEGFDVDVSNKADTSTGFLYSNVLSEHFDTIEEAIEYANQIIQGDKEYIKKVDTELAALDEGEKSNALPLRATQIADEVVSEIVPKPEFFYKKLQDGTIQDMYDRYFNSPDVKNPTDGFMLEFEKIATGYKETFGSNASKLQQVRKALELPREEFFKAFDNIAFNHRSTAGTNADALIRESLSFSNEGIKFKAIPYTSSIDINGQQVKVSDIMTKDAYDALFDPNKGIIAPLLNAIFDNNLRVLSNNVLVFDKSLRENGITGELDLLALTTDGKLKIIDIKLSSGATWKSYEKENNRRKLEHRAQQSVYQTLVYNMTGIRPNISILPIEFEANLDGKITTIKRSSLLAEGQNVYDLEYLPEIEKAGIVRVDPAISKVPISSKGESTPVVKQVGSVEKTDLSKLSLKDNIDKDLIYNGKAGKLVKQSDGVFGIQYTNEAGVETIIDLLYNGQPAKDGNIILNKVGLSPVTEITEVAQVAVINNNVIDAKFENNSESIATINGVRYMVNRDKTQSIVSLTYRVNDAKISEIENETERLSSELAQLKETNKQTKEKFAKNDILKKMAETQAAIYALNSQREALVSNNPERTIRGGNANDLIFALNKLPRAITKGHTQKRSLDEKQEVKEITNLSTSSSVSNKLYEIINSDYLDTLDKLFTEGVNALSKAELNGIKAWGKETLVKLQKYAGELIDEYASIDDVENEINYITSVLNDLELINLGKNGKILKQQPKEVLEKFGPRNTTEVQTGSDQSNVQQPTGGQAETILGPATKEELGEIVNSTKVTDEELFNDWDTETPVIDFSKAKNMDELNKLTAETLGNNPESASEIAEAYNVKQQELKTKISIDNLEVGELLLAKVPIFTEYENEIVSVKQIKGNNVIVKHLRSNETKTFTEEEMKQMFNKTTNEAVENMNAPIVTQEDVANSEGTKDNFENFSKDSEEISKLEREADIISKDNIISKIQNNAKHC